VSFSWKSLFSSRGRIGRKTFWSVAIPITVIEIIIQAASGAAGDNPLLLLLLPVALVCVVINICNTAKRLHDLGWRGWWMFAPVAIVIFVDLLAMAVFGAESTGAVIVTLLAFLIPLAFLIVLGSRRGDEGPNRFGEPPPTTEPATAAT